MNNSNFEIVYEAVARPLDKRQLPPEPFGPLLVKILLEDGEVIIVASLPPEVIVPYFSSDEGREIMESLIAEIIAKEGDDFYMLKAFECYTKVIEHPEDDAVNVMKEKRLDIDPTAQHSVCMVLYNKSGQRTGILKIDDERVLHYATMLPDYAVPITVKADAKPLH